MKKLVVATNNAHKLSEIRAIIGNEIELLTLADINCYDDIPETAETLEGNALQKARYIYEKYGVDCFADDTGLEVTALGGGPGVHTARYAYADRHDPKANTEKLLRELEGATDRSAQFRTVVALILNGEEHLFEGIVRGRIAEERQGEAGFGYDPIFVPESCNESFAQMAAEKKNSMSHRSRAASALNDYLQTL